MDVKQKKSLVSFQSVYKYISAIEFQWISKDSELLFSPIFADDIA